MSRVPDSVKNQARKVLSGMEEEVTIYLFTNGCETCEDAKELNRVISKSSDKVKLTEKPLDSEVAGYFNADKYDKGPVQVLATEENQLKFFGLPVGQEFESYLKSIVDVSKNTTKLDRETKKKLEGLDEDVNLKIFVTPTCPYCSKAARAGYMISMENKHVEADVIEAQEYPQLSRNFGVRGVPQVNINYKQGQFTGALPPSQFADRILKAVK